MGAAFRFAMPALGAAVFAYALLRSGSLALPIGLHWGGNWVQSSLFGLGETAEPTSAIWVMPLAPDQVRSITAPDLLPHLPYLAVLALTVLAVRLAVPSRPQPTRAWS